MGVFDEILDLFMESCPHGKFLVPHDCETFLLEVFTDVMDEFLIVFIMRVADEDTIGDHEICLVFYAVTQ